MGTTKKRRLAVLGASVVMTLVLVPYLLNQSDPALIARTLSGMSPEWALAALMLFGLNYVLRSVRFTILLGLPLIATFWSMLRVVCLHNALNYMLPARLGELSFIYLARRERAVSISAGTVSLMAARFFDLIAMGMWLTLAALLLPRQGSVSIRELRLTGLASVAVVALAWWLAPTLLGGMERGMACLPLGQLVVRISAFVGQVRRGLLMLGSWRVYSLVMLTSLTMWLGVFSIYYCLLRAFDLNVGLAEVIIGSSLFSLSNVLPVHGLLGFGTTEALWTVSFALVGMDTGSSVVTGFATHIVILVYVLGLGGLALLASGLRTVWLAMQTCGQSEMS